MSGYRLLDLFCCAGGASTGYVQAGFEVVGVDIAEQPNYPFDFIRKDVLDLDVEWVRQFDAVHASPPCQGYSVLAARTGTGDKWAKLVPAMRAFLRESGVPYVIENVVGAPLLDPLTLCGTMFPELRVIRHRLFESNVQLLAPGPCRPHPLCHTLDKRKRHYGLTDEWRDYVQVNGGGNCSVAAARDAMGIDWMTKKELNEAIPPAYTRLLGLQLIEHLDGR